MPPRLARKSVTAAKVCPHVRGGNDGKDRGRDEHPPPPGQLVHGHERLKAGQRCFSNCCKIDLPIDGHSVGRNGTQCRKVSEQGNLRSCRKRLQRLGYEESRNGGEHAECREMRGHNPHRTRQTAYMGVRGAVGMAEETPYACKDNPRKQRANDQGWQLTRESKARWNGDERVVNEPYGSGGEAHTEARGKRM